MSEEQHVLEIDDDFELNAKAAEDAAAEAKDQEENSETPPADDEAPADDDKSDTPADDDQPGDDSGDESGEIDSDQGQVSDQNKIDSIVSSRLKQQSVKHDLALQKERQESLKLKRQLDDLRQLS